MNQLTRPMNQFEGLTSHEPRPDRRLKEYRYADEGSFLLARDQWDAAERAREHLEVEGRRVDKDIAERAAAQAKAETERSDAVVNDELRRRYLSAGGDPARFDKELPELRHDHARRVALGIDRPLNSVAVLKDQLRQARSGMNLASAPHPTATDDA